MDQCLTLVVFLSAMLNKVCIGNVSARQREDRDTHDAASTLLHPDMLEVNVAAMVMINFFKY